MEVEYGKRLKDARLEKGLSIEDVSFDLKINGKTLRKIEGSETKCLPKAPFTRGFIRTYCLHLDVDPGVVIEEYEQTLDDPSRKLKKGVLSNESSEKTFFAFEFFKTKLVPLTILFLMLLGAGAAYLYLGSGPLEKLISKKIEAPKVQVETKIVKDKVLGPAKVDNLPQKLTRVATVYDGGKIIRPKRIEKIVEPVKPPAPVKVEEKVLPVTPPKYLLVVEPLADTSLYIKTNLDKKYIRASLKPDVLRRFRFDSAIIKFRDAGAVNLIFNGKDIGALGIFGEEKTIKFPSMNEL